MIIKEILRRRAIREYKSDKVPEEYIIEIIKAGQFAPSAKGIRAVEFIIVKNQETKNDIFKIVGQEFIKQAPVLIVPVCDTSKTDFSIQDISLTSENIFLESAALGLGTVWKNIGLEGVEKIKELLSIPKQYAVVNIIPVGYPQNDVEPHTNKDFDDKKIHQEKW